MNWLLLSTVGLFAVCMFRGYCCGFVRMVFSVSTFLITAVLVYLLAPVGVRILQNNEKIYNAVRAPIEDILEEKVNENITIEEMLQFHNVMQKDREDIIKAVEKNGFVKNDLFDASVQEIITDCLTLKVIDLIAYVGLFLIINIVLRVISVFLFSLTKLPVIKETNQIAGCLLGLLEGVAVLWLFFVVITIFATTGWAAACFEMIGNSRILSTLYSKNLFLIFI